ncbi:hypothetical protein [Chelatococcus reniformis]|uniref:Uncharacterized protein n=1 Tax=Chelatococcus reniformis TaxID=1494448 RepID=A0A916UH69_9HYPH|nr:hypothetical protein [Chelatococcus reniformis]GGC70813.1 hypothetical protein GCM10010994_31740 [Chelatococcus reniformis]
MADHPDMAALAAAGDGTLRRYSPVWSYPGAPLDPNLTANQRLPLANVSAGAVASALADGSWVVTETDAAGAPAAITPAPGPGRVRTAAEGGTVGLRRG